MKQEKSCRNDVCIEKFVRLTLMKLTPIGHGCMEQELVEKEFPEQNLPPLLGATRLKHFF
jgi:hypothetical protein